jgi:hypothetical protein
MTHALIMLRRSMIVEQFVDKTRLCLFMHLTISMIQRSPTITTPQTASNQTAE